MKKTYSVLFAVIFSFVTASAQESQTEYNFLRLPMSAHAGALGGDNISIIEDDEALIFNNPALLSTVSDKTINLNYLNYMSGSNCLSAAFNKIIKERASVAVSAQYIEYGSMKQTDENNVQSGDFSAKDIAIAGYFSYMLTDQLAGGVTAKFITSYIGDYNSIGVGVDLGLNYYNTDLDLSASLVAKNLGGQVKAYDDQFERIPFDLQAGISKRLAGAPLRFHATLSRLTDWDEPFIRHLAIGADILLGESVYIAGGYSFRRAHDMRITDTEGESAHGAGFSLGAGLTLQRFKLHVGWGKYHVSTSSLLINISYAL